MADQTLMRRSPGTILRLRDFQLLWIIILVKKQEWSDMKRKLVLAVCTVLFGGGFRAGELLSTDLHFPKIAPSMGVVAT